MAVRDFDRRSFIRAATVSAGALIASSKLPSFAGDADQFSRRGKFERMSVGVIHVEAGAVQPFSLLHISDTHLTDAYPDEDQWKQKLKAQSTPHFGGFQEDALRESVAWAKANCDYLVHTGDIMDWHSRKNMDLAKKYLGAAGALGCIGNHEYTLYHYLSKEAKVYKSPEEIRKILQPYFPYDLTFSSQVVNGVNFIGIDDAHGRVTADQVKRFKAEVAKGYPIILLKHVPFYTDAIWTAADKFWTSGKHYRTKEVPPRRNDALVQRNDPLTRDFIAYLKTVKELKAILAGHEHIAVRDRFSPTAMEYVVAGNFLFSGQEVLVS